MQFSQHVNRLPSYVNAHALTTASTPRLSRVREGKQAGQVRICYAPPRPVSLQSYKTFCPALFCLSYFSSGAPQHIRIMLPSRSLVEVSSGAALSYISDGAGLCQCSQFCPTSCNSSVGAAAPPSLPSFSPLWPLLVKHLLALFMTCDNVKELEEKHSE